MNRIASSSIETARGNSATPGSRSTRTTSMPRIPRAFAMASPVGPPPTIRTDVSIVLGDMLCHHLVVEDPDALDLGLHPVAGREQHLRIAAESDSAGRAGENHVAGLERDELRQLRHRERDVEDHP